MPDISFFPYYLLCVNFLTVYMSFLGLVADGGDLLVPLLFPGCQRPGFDMQIYDAGMAADPSQ